MFVICGINLQTNFKKAKHKKKCGAHTHVHHSSQLSSSIFTSVVVYSRTTTQKKKTTKKCVVSRTLLFLILRGHVYFSNKHAQLCNTKKKMRSTHACTPSFATFLLNIHVGCCLFSHNLTNYKNKTKNSGDRNSTSLNRHRARSSIIIDHSPNDLFFTNCSSSFRKKMMIMFSYASRGCILLTNVTTSFI